MRLLACARIAAPGAHAPCSWPTDNVADACAGKPAPVQFRLNVSAAGPGNTTLIEPDGAILPDQAPLASHEVALVLDQFTVAVCPGITALGLTDTVTVAWGGGVGFVGVGNVNEPEPQPEITKTNENTTITKE